MSKNTAKSSNADYPVAQSELVSQQNRLRKAAAAGADALKGPASFRPSSAPAAMPQKSSEPQAGLAQIPSSRETAPMPEAAPVPEIPARPEVVTAQPQDNEAILVELRRISAWADVQRKITRWSLIVLAVFIPALIVFGVLLEKRVSTNVEDFPPRPKPDWYDVERNVRSGDLDKAIGMGEELIQKTPEYPEAHKRLAEANLAADKLDKAREHYAEAFRLLPSEENEKLLMALDKRN